MTFLVCWIALLLTLWSTPLLILLSFVLTGRPDVIAFLRRIADKMREGDQ